MRSPYFRSGRPRSRRLVAAVLVLVSASLIAAMLAAEAERTSLALSYHITKVGEFASDHGKGIWGYSPGDGREYVLLCRGHDLAVIDVTVPSLPVQVAEVPVEPAPGGKAAHDSASGEPNLVDVRVYGHYAIAVSQVGPVQIIDLDPPEAAHTAALFSTASILGAHTVEIDGNYAYLSLYGIGPADLHIVDLTNPLAPVDVGRWTHPDHALPSNAQAHDCYVRDNRAYSFYLEGGVGILDITDRSAPATLGIVNYPGSFTHSGWLTEDGRYLLTCDEVYDGHLRVFDVSNPASAPQVGEYRPKSDAAIHNVYVRGRYAFIAYYSEGLRVVDMGDPTRPVEVGFYDTHPAGGSVFGGAYAAFPYAPSGNIYLSDMNAGLLVFRFDGARAGWIAGAVHDGQTGQTLAGARVTLNEAGKILTSADDGEFGTGVAAGIHTLAFSHYGYSDAQAYVPVIGLSAPAQVTQNLTPVANAGTVTGTVRTPGALPIAGAIVQMPGEPDVQALTNGAGGFTVRPLPAGPQQLAFARFGYLPRLETAQVAAGQTLQKNIVLIRGIEDDAELDQGWEYGEPGDGALSGTWRRAVPHGTWIASAAVQPDEDHTPGGGSAAFITGPAAAGASAMENNLDGGRTTLLSPEFDLTGVTVPVLRYYRWFYTNLPSSPDDWMRAEISNDGGQSWMPVESVTGVANQWARRDFNLLQILPATTHMRIRFIAADEGISSIVEAAIDDISVYDAAASGVPEGGPAGLVVHGAAPNPFARSTSVRFSIGAPASVTARVFDGTGRLVRDLSPGAVPAGESALAWDGRDDNGRPAAAGVYWMAVAAGGRTERAKILRVP